MTTWIDIALDRYEAPLLRFATRLTGCPQRAADLVQDAFCALCRQPRAQVANHLAEWLYTTVRNRAIDHHRKDHRMTLVAPDTQAETAAANVDPAAPVEAAETNAALHQALAGLSDRQQDIVRLKFQDGLRYREIAQALGISEGTVARTMHEAMARLRAGRRLEEAV